MAEPIPKLSDLEISSIIVSWEVMKCAVEDHPIEHQVPVELVKKDATRAIYKCRNRMHGCPFIVSAKVDADGVIAIIRPSRRCGLYPQDSKQTVLVTTRRARHHVCHG